MAFLYISWDRALWNPALEIRQYSLEKFWRFFMGNFPRQDFCQLLLEKPFATHRRRHVKVEGCWTVVLLDGGLRFSFLQHSLAAQGVQRGLNLFFGGASHPVDEEDAVQVIGFVLDDAGEQAIATEFCDGTVGMDCIHVHCFGAKDGAVDFGEAEASFLAGDGGVQWRDLRV